MPRVEYATNLAMIIFFLVALRFTVENSEGKELDSRWIAFKENFNKTYQVGLEKLRRRLWEINIKLIEKHNEEAKKGLHSFTLKPNTLADMSRQQYLNRMARLVPLRRKKVGDEMLGATYTETPKEAIERKCKVFLRERLISKQFDWRNEGFSTPPWNQKSCGSCYAFSIAAGVQGQIMKETGKLQMLSAQQIVDCSAVYGNNGCIGGSFRNTMNYIEKVGLMEAKEYPYKAQASRCVYDAQKVVANISSWNAVPANDEKSLQVAVATMGPVAVSLDASPRTFQLYSGIYDDPECSSTKLNHAVLVVGYTEHAWIVKNWWGKSWGEEGYMRIAKKKNRCGIASYAVYAIL